MRKMLRGILLMRQSSELTPYHDTKRRSNEHKWQTEETKLSSLFQDLLSKKNLLEVKERRLKTEYSIASFLQQSLMWFNAIDSGMISPPIHTKSWAKVKKKRTRGWLLHPKQTNPETETTSLILLLQINDDYKQNTNSWLLSLLLLPLLCSTLYFRCKLVTFKRSYVDSVD